MARFFSDLPVDDRIKELSYRLDRHHELLRALAQVCGFKLAESYSDPNNLWVKRDKPNV